MHIAKLKVLLSSEFIQDRLNGATLAGLVEKYNLNITDEQLDVVDAINRKDIDHPSRYSNCYLFIKREGCPTENEYADYITGGNLDHLFYNSRQDPDAGILTECFKCVFNIIASAN